MKPAIPLREIAITVVALVSTFVVLSARTGRDPVPAIAQITVPLAEMPEVLPLPEISAEVIADAESGLNVIVRTEQFRLLPDGTDPDVAGGYAYLSVDGGPRVRLYSPWTHLPDIQDGTHTLEISLSNEEFRPYGVNGEPLAVRYDVTLKAGEVTFEEA